MHVIAHRGYSALFPENTLLAFEEAFKAGAWMIETDIRLSSDEVPMIFHDSTLRRVCGTSDGIEDLKSGTLKTIDISTYFDPKLPVQYIPTLDETLSFINGRIGMILEIKHHPLTCHKIPSIVEPMIKDRLDWLEVSSFDDGILERFNKLNPSIRLHKLIEESEVLEQPNFDTLYDYPYAFDIDIALLHHPKTQELMKTKKVIFWTVDKEDPSTFKEAYAAMSNDPIILMKSCHTAGLI